MRQGSGWKKWMERQGSGPNKRTERPREAHRVEAKGKLTLSKRVETEMTVVKKIKEDIVFKLVCADVNREV